MKSLWWNSHGLLIVFERWWLGMYPWHLITNSNMGWKTGCFANRILRWIGQGIVKVKWWSSPDGFKLERWKLYLTDLTGCKLWTLRCKKKESRRVLPFFESVLKPRTVLGSIFSTALILVFGTVGVAQNCHSFCSVPPWLFGKSGGSMSFIDFTVGVVFFLTVGRSASWRCSKPCTEFVAVVKMVLLEEGLIFKETTKVWTLDPLSWLVEVGPIKTHHCIFGMKTSWLGQSSV